MPKPSRTHRSRKAAAAEDTFRVGLRSAVARTYRDAFERLAVDAIRRDLLAALQKVPDAARL